MELFDEIDRKLIAILQQDARAASPEIARQVGISERTVRNRIKRLTERGVISLTAVVHPRSFGYTTFVDIFCTIDDIQNIESVTNTIAALPNVNYVAISTGEQDISIQALFKSNDELYPFIRTLGRIPGVRHTRSVMTALALKNPYAWLPPADEFKHNTEK